MSLKSKNLYNITINNCTIRVRLSYNLKTNHYTIGNDFCCQKSYYKNNKKYYKQYYKNNRNKFKQNYENSRKLNTNRQGSEEYKIEISCRQQGIVRKDWNGFVTKQKYCNLFNEKFREKIRDRFYRKCFLCNKSEINNGKRLSVHHVNYNKNCLCGSVCEFVPLCMKCHAKTNGSRQYWEDLIMCYLYPNRYFMVDL